MPDTMKALNQISLRLVVLFFSYWATAAEPNEFQPAHQTAEPTFRSHVQSVLTKSGCNAGACHGAAGGKNGFYLSLRG